MKRPSARVRANRLNALKSTGPRTPQGKARTALNALTHGLCARTLVAAPASIERLAQLIAGPRPTRARLALAREIALADDAVRRARRARQELMATPPQHPMRSLARLAKDVRAMAELAKRASEYAALSRTVHKGRAPKLDSRPRFRNLAEKLDRMTEKFETASYVPDEDPSHAMLRQARRLLRYEAVAAGRRRRAVAILELQDDEGAAISSDRSRMSRSSWV